MKADTQTSDDYDPYDLWLNYICEELKQPNLTHDVRSPNITEYHYTEPLSVFGVYEDLGHMYGVPEQCNNISALLQYYDYDMSSLVRLPERYIVPVVFGLTFAVGLVGNALVVYVVLKSGAMKTVTNLYMMNLALADLLFLLFCVPFTGVLYVLPNWPFGESMCKLVNYMMVVTMASSVMTMMAMSIDRYHAVVHPVKSKSYRTVKRTVVALLCVWAFNLVTLTPVAMLSRLVAYWQYGGSQDMCVEYFDTIIRRQVYTLSLFLVYYVAPLGVIAGSYFLMARTLWASVSPWFLQENMAIAMKSRRRVTKMVLVVVLVFAGCWLPIHCVHLHNDFGEVHVTTAYNVISILAHCLSYINSAVNPFIYAFMSDNFRQMFKVAFRICKRKRSVTKVFIVVDPEAIPGSNSSGMRRHGSVAMEQRNLSVHLSMRVSTNVVVTGSRDETPGTSSESDRL